VGRECYLEYKHLPGERRFTLLGYGPVEMADDLADIVQRNHLGADLYVSPHPETVKMFLKLQPFNIYLYHIAMEKIIGEKTQQEFVEKTKEKEFPLPRIMKAELLGYGVMTKYDQRIISRYKLQFEMKFLNALEEL